MWCSIVDIMDPVAATNEMIRNAATNNAERKRNQKNAIRMVFSRLWHFLSGGPKIEPTL